MLWLALSILGVTFPSEEFSMEKEQSEREKKDSNPLERLRAQLKVYRMVFEGEHRTDTGEQLEIPPFGEEGRAEQKGGRE